MSAKGALLAVDAVGNRRRQCHPPLRLLLAGSNGGEGKGGGTRRKQKEKTHTPARSLARPPSPPSTLTHPAFVTGQTTDKFTNHSGAGPWPSVVWGDRRGGGAMEWQGVIMTLPHFCSPVPTTAKEEVA